MTSGRKKISKGQDSGIFKSTRSMRDEAEKKLAESPDGIPELKKQTPEELIHELQVHQIELETQAEELRGAHIALEESRDHYLDLYDFAPLGYLTLTDKALIARINITMAGLLGIERKKLTGSRFRQHIVPEDLHIWDDFFMGLLNSEKKLSATLMVRRHDGSSFPARMEGVRFTGTGDGTATIRVAVSDITDIRQAERARRESEYLLKTVIELLPVGVLILNAQGEVISKNPEADRIWGGAHVVGTGLSSDYKGWRLEDGVRIEARDWAGARAIEKGKITLDEQIEIACPGDIHKIVLNSALPIRGSDGGITGAVVVIQDITEGKMAEEQIRWLASFPELNPNPVIELDAGGIVTFANTSTRTILKDLRLPDDPGLFVPHDREEILRLLQEGSKSQIYREIMLGNETFGEDISLDNGLQVVRIYARNITWRKRSEDLLKSEAVKLARLSDAFQNANRKLNLLSSITRHDINNQLLVLNTFLELLSKNSSESVNVEYIDHLMQASTRITDMIRFMKIYEDVGVRAPVCFDCRNLVETATHGQSEVVQLKNDLPSGREVMADPLISRVFFNLVDNAVRYGEKITTIRFSGGELDGDYLIVCEDDGIGIPADQKEKIFERGYGRNTGLGLFLSREIAAITGITIQETGKPGQGARFEIRVPKGMWHIAAKGKKRVKPADEDQGSPS
jgi:PAS domain S-box-containing protein